VSWRWMKFNLVGAIGIGVQLGVLGLLTVGLKMNYLVATALAVEITVLHNFVWHERFTWRDRTRRWWRGGEIGNTPTLAPKTGARGWGTRLLRFNFTTGLISIGGNLLLMRLLTGQAHLPPVVANLMSIAACSVVNYLVSDRWVFARAAA